MKQIKYCIVALGAVLLAAINGFAAVEGTVSREGAEKYTVSLDIKGDQAFVRSLRRNLELSGVFEIRSSGSIKVSGEVGGRITAEGRQKVMGLNSQAKDAASARNEARVLANKMVENYSNQTGFALNQIAFVSKHGNAGELYVCYPDGYDMKKLTSDSKEAVGPRWKDSQTLFYTGFLGGGPGVYEVNTTTGKKARRWNFKGLTTGATMSPDGRSVAIILSIHGNPELYVIDAVAGRWTRLTTTKNASEGQPCWSPDGSQIVYVSDESRYPQLYVIDVATKKKRRLTAKGSQNVDPDWGSDGRITYITKRGGTSQIAILDPNAGGDANAVLVAEAGNWEHPSWACDNRHVVASRDKALFIVDTMEDGDKPVRLFNNDGKWITPSWKK